MYSKRPLYWSLTPLSHRKVLNFFMIAYFLLVHRYPNQFKRLFRAIYSPLNEYLVHIDKRAGPALRRELGKFLKDYPNASLLKSQNVVWGGYSMVETELRGMKQLLKQSSKWDHFINLSGQDFPLKTQSTIRKFLKVNKGKDFILTANQKNERLNTLNRIENYFVESDNGFSGKPFKRAYLRGVTPYIGGQWKILSRLTVEFFTNNSKVDKFITYYKNTLIPDESFFQTVIMNSGLEERVISDDKRAIIWIPDIALKNKGSIINKEDTQSQIESGKIKLRPKTYLKADLKYLLSSRALFARKFDETVDSEILDLLEAKLKADGNGIDSADIAVPANPLQTVLPENQLIAAAEISA